jgi:hydrogenase nickel incorporation protein HypA/HybF
MHELSLAQALVDQIEDLAKREGATSVDRVTVVIGALSGVEREAFEFAYPIAAEGSVLEGSELLVEEAPARVHCEACGWEGATELAWMRCAECGAQDVRIISGKEFTIREVDLECPVAGGDADAIVTRSEEDGGE